MKFNVLTCFPDLVEYPLQFGLVGEGRKKNLWSLTTHNLRAYGKGNHSSIDDRPYGGGDGMVIQAPVLAQALKDISLSPEYSLLNPSAIYYLSPQGPRFTQQIAQSMLKQFNQVTLICGRYAGVDQRFLNHFSIQEISIGDYILSGGELAAQVVIDTIARLIPGVLGNAVSATEDSLSQSHTLLEPPLFTRPAIWEGQKVPDVLLSGDHARIQQWKQQISLLMTFIKRPDLFDPNLASQDRLSMIFNQLSSEDKVSLGIPANFNPGD